MRKYGTKKIKILLTAAIGLMILAPELKAAGPGYIDVKKTRLYYHYARTANPKGLVVFLHGSVKAFQGMLKSRPVRIDTLLENNDSFIACLAKRGYDVILPVAYNEYNWLEPGGMYFVDTLMEIFASKYPSIIISGFSDGGTGAYRIFYKNPSRYSALLVFNGYPQLENFYKKVDYKSVTLQKIIFISQKSDRVVPYEFLLTEYRRQKPVNNNTYFMLTEGRHEFGTYTVQNFESCLRMLELQPQQRINTPDSIWLYPAVDGLVINNEIIELYKFRKSVAKKYGMNKSEYREGGLTNTVVGRDTLKIYPVKLSQSDILKPEFEFIMELNGVRKPVFISNFAIYDTW